jgi:hypothetical protein
MRPQKGTRVTKGIFLCLLCFFVTELFYPTAVAACEFRFPKHGLEVHRNFSVLIEYEGKPLPGVVVYATPLFETSHEVIQGTTTTDGTLRLKNLRPGNYFLGTKWLGVSAGSQQIEVRARETIHATSRLEYSWGEAPILLRRVAGKVIDIRPRPIADSLQNMVKPLEVPLSGALVELRHPTNGTAYSTVTDDHGEFAFEEALNGTYVVHIESGTNPIFARADFLVQVTPTAARESLHVGRSSICGGYYLQLQR